MKRFGIVSDSSHDLEEDYLEEHNIKSISFYVRLEDDVYLKDQVDITRKEFYKYLRDNKDFYPKTSLPSVDDYLKAFREELSSGKDILCFTVASTLSGSFQSANVAATMAKEEYPDREIYVIDSKSASTGVGLLIKKAVDLRNEGKDIEEIKEKLMEIANTSEVYICLDTLSYLENGGRISRTKAMAGNLLKIKPVVSYKGNKLVFEAAVRGTKKAINKGLELLEERIKNDPKLYEVFVIHGDCEDLARKVKDSIEKIYNIKLNFDVALVSPAVISHIGPGAIGIGCSKVY